MKKSLSCKTYAKINLSLDVTGVRDDGYHEVAMIMQGIDLYDEMRVRILPSDVHAITLKTDKYYVPVDERNTAYKAARLIMERYITDPMEIRIDIKKNIPVAAGLAGGSSNAAGVLLALNEMLELGMSLEKMCKLGQEIGADVPFSLMSMAAVEKEFGINGGSTCALSEGIGEILTPLPKAEFWVTLAKPPISVSTAAVYRMLDQIGEYSHPNTQKVIKGIKNRDLKTIGESMGNVLEYVTLKKFPDVYDLKKMLHACAEDVSAGTPTMMSGSGPTLYSLFYDCGSAERAADLLKSTIKNRKIEIFSVKTI